MTGKPKRKNHEVAKAFLKRWATDHGEGRPQLAVLDAKTGSLEIRSAEATFAIGNFLYVPKLNGERDDRVEDWFSEAEQALVEFLRLVDNKGTEPISDKQWIKMLFGAVGLAHRSAYEVQRLREAVKASKKLQKGLAATSASDDAVHHVVMENLVNRISRDVNRLAGSTLTIIADCTPGLLVCDRPALVRHLGRGPTLLSPLGPRSMLYTDGEWHGAPVRVASATAEGIDTAPLVRTMNAFTIKRARRWVVGNSPEELEVIADAVKAHAQEVDEPLVVEPISELERAVLWSFGRDEKL